MNDDSILKRDEGAAQASRLLSLPASELSDVSSKVS